MTVEMDKYLKYLPAEDALVPKTCRFCHALMEFKQINLTVAVRQCYQCATPLQHLDFSDIEFYRRSYRDRDKSPSDWSTLENSEEEELKNLNSWVEKLNISLSKYEESSDDDMTASNSKNSRQYSCNQLSNESDDLNFDDMVHGLQTSGNNIDKEMPNEWISEELDELDALLECVSSRKSENVTDLPFSPHDLLFSKSAEDSKESNVNPSINDGCWYPEALDEPLEPVSAAGHVSAADKSVLTMGPSISESVKFITAEEPSTPVSEETVLSDECLTSEITESTPVQGPLTIGTLDSSSVKCLNTSEIIESFSVARFVTSEDTESVSSDASVLEKSYSMSDCVNTFHKPPTPDCEGSSELQRCGASLVTGRKQEIGTEHDTLVQQSNQDDITEVVPLLRKEEVELAAIGLENRCEMLGTEKNNNNRPTYTQEKENSVKLGVVEDVKATSTIATEKQNEGIDNIPVKPFQNQGTIISYSPVSVCSPHHQTAMETPNRFPVCRSEIYSDQEDSDYRFPSQLESSRITEPTHAPVSMEMTLSSLIHPIAYNQPLIIEAMVCDCKDEHLQLPSLSESHCVDVKLPDISLSSLKVQTIVEDFEETTYTFPSDLDKVMFTDYIHHPKNTTTEKGLCQDIDTELEEVRQTVGVESETALEECTPAEVSPSMISLPPPFDLATGSLLVTVPADIDITSEMIESASLGNVLIQGLDSVFVEASTGEEQSDCGSSAVHLNAMSSETPALSFHLQDNGDVHIQPGEVGIDEDPEFIQMESNCITPSPADHFERNCLDQPLLPSVSTKASTNKNYFEDEFNKISSICVDQPLRLTGVTVDEDDEELKCFTGAKFKPVPNRKLPLKEGGVETGPRYLNLMQAIQRDIATAASEKK